MWKKLKANQLGCTTETKMGPTTMKISRAHLSRAYGPLPVIRTCPLTHTGASRDRAGEGKTLLKGWESKKDPQHPKKFKGQITSSETPLSIPASAESHPLLSSSLASNGNAGLEHGKGPVGIPLPARGNPLSAHVAAFSFPPPPPHSQSLAALRDSDCAVLPSAVIRAQ